jgi:hypothetical protein
VTMTDPLSWQFQANLHGATDEDGEDTWWRWWLLPWHRGYI